MDDTAWLAWLERYLTRDMPSVTGPVDETSPDLDPTDEPPNPRQLRTVRYSPRVAEQVRALGGIEAEAALITATAPREGP